MFAETKKKVLVEYPISTVYDALVTIFPVKYYKLRYYDETVHTLTVYDSYNRGFTMRIQLMENTPNTTVINFLTDYPNAIMDLTGGGTQAIEMVLEKLLNQLAKQPKTGVREAQGNDIEVVDADTFVCTTKNRKHTTAIVTGYVLSILGVVLPLIALINYDSSDSLMATFFVAGIICLAIEISLSVILQYNEDSKSLLHGRIQICICGLTLIILGAMIHPGLAIAGILIPIVAMGYTLQREKAI